MSVTKFDKEQFLSLVINKLATEDGLKEIFYQKMLLGLHDNDPVYKTDAMEHTEGGVTIPSDVLSNILNNIDWEMLTSTAYGEDEFFNGPDGLYTSLGNALREIFEAEGNNYKRMDLVGSDNNWWTNSYWNESIAKLLQILAQKTDLNNIKTYEKSGLLIEVVEPPENDGIIDVNHLRSGIIPERGNYTGTLAELRIIDIINADAGYSFEGENDTYWFGKYFDKITYSYRKDSQSELQSVTYEKILYKQEALEVLTAIENGYEIDVKELNKLLYKNSDDSYIYSGERISEHIPSFPTQGVIAVTMETEGEKYTFKVVKNPWVIPWYNIDGETYRRVRGEDKKLSALTDSSRLDFTRLNNSNTSTEDTDRWIRLIMPQYKRRVEVEDLNRNFWVIGQVLAGICIDIFDPNGPIGAMIKGLLSEIAQLWENVVFLWAALALLSQKRFYGETHSEVVIIPSDKIYPYLKYDNFNREYLNANALIPNLNYLLQVYPEKNLCILPCVRFTNYEKNYYQDIWIPGIFIYDKNEEQWELIPFEETNTNLDTNLGGIYINLSDYKDQIYGLHEKEEVYNFIAPLEGSEEIQPEEDTRYYGIARDNIDFGGELYKYIDNEWIEDKTINFSLKLYDLAYELSEKEKKLILSLESEYNEGTMVIDILTNVYGDEPIEILDQTEKKIEKGFYQGELLSAAADIMAITYDVHVQDYNYVNLNPDGNMSTSDIIANPNLYKQTYWANDKNELEAELNRIWEENHYTHKDILFLKGTRTYASDYKLPCGFGIMFYVKGEKQEYYYPLVTESLGFNGIVWMSSRDEDGNESAYGTNYNTSEFIILRQGSSQKLTPTNWSIMFISCYGGQTIPYFKRNDSGYLGSVKALDSLTPVPEDIQDWPNYNPNAKRWSSVHGPQPGLQQQTDLQNDTNFQDDIEEMSVFLKRNEYTNPDGYYINGGIFMGQTILAFGPGENQWGSQTYQRIPVEQWTPDGLTWTKVQTINGSEKGFEDLRRDYIAFLNLNSNGKPYALGTERNYDRFKDNGRDKKQNGDSLTDWQSYTWVNGNWNS